MSREIMQQVLVKLIAAQTCHPNGVRFLIEEAFQMLEAELAKPEQEPVANEKEGSPCPEFWDWLPKAYNFAGDGVFTKYNMEVAFLAGKQFSSTEPPRKECEIEQAKREERGWCHQLVWDYGFSRVDNEDVQEACSILAKQILARSKK